jgi:hypothetical protein
MAKFYGKIGFSAGNTEVSPGVWEDTIVERLYIGDVTRNAMKFREADKINNDFTVNNSISIVADAYANQNISAMRYVVWMGTRWVISDVDVLSPRLTLRLGGVYNGPTAPTPQPPGGGSG